MLADNSSKNPSKDSLAISFLAIFLEKYLQIKKHYKL